MPHRAWPLPGTAVLTAVLHLPQPSVPVCMPHGQTDGCMTDANTRGCGPSASWISDPISFLSCDYCTLHPTVSVGLLLQYGIVRCRGLMSAWRYSPGRKPRRLTAALLRKTRERQPAHSRPQIAGLESCALRLRSVDSERGHSQGYLGQLRSRSRVDSATALLIWNGQSEKASTERAPRCKFHAKCVSASCM